MKKYLFIYLIFTLLILYGCTQQAYNSAGSNEQNVDTDSYYVRYDKDNYEQSLAEGKVDLLDFYANWCPICRSENPKIIEGLAELNNPNVIAYQVHFNDDETTPDDEELAREFGVTYQHTKVILKNGNVALKSLEAWNKEKTLKELRKVI